MQNSKKSFAYGFRQEMPDVLTVELGTYDDQKQVLVGGTADAAILATVKYTQGTTNNGGDQKMDDN